MSRPRYGWHPDLPTCPHCGNQSGFIEYMIIAGKRYSRKHYDKCKRIYDSDLPPGMDVSFATRNFYSFRLLDRRR